MQGISYQPSVSHFFMVLLTLWIRLYYCEFTVIIPITVIITYFRCHSYCWPIWKTGKTTEKLLQEMFGVGEKIWPSNCGKRLLVVKEVGFSYVAKCNLGKVNLEAMLVSSFPSYAGGGPMPLAGAPCDVYTQFVCLQLFAKCCSNSLLLAFHFVLCFFPIPPYLFRLGPVKCWLVSIPLTCSVWRCLVATSLHQSFLWLHPIQA